MPEISRFLGLIITMYYSEHPPPHFHARYGEQKAVIAIDPPVMIQGQFPPRVYGLVIEWATLHREELLENWRLITEQAPLRSIAPLE